MRTLSVITLIIAIGCSSQAQQAVVSSADGPVAFRVIYFLSQLKNVSCKITILPRLSCSWCIGQNILSLLWINSMFLRQLYIHICLPDRVGL